MEERAFIQMDLRQRFDCLQEKGKHLVAIHEPLYLVHLYSIGSFFAELRLDPTRYSVLSVEVFNERHPRYVDYMEKIDMTEAK